MRNLILIMILVMISGCGLGKVEGISASAGSFERGLWFDHDKKEYQPHGWGIKCDLVVGHMIRPVPKFWKKDQNVWKGDEPWFVIRTPMIAPFGSVSLGEIGIYAGCKTFVVTSAHSSQERYGKWMREKEFPSDPNGTMTYLQLSGTIRRTRWK